MKNWVVMFAVCFALAGCGDSGLNPFGWLGGQSETEETLNDFEIVTIEDPRPLVPQVTSLRIDRTPGGAIIRASGLPQQQGWHSASLVVRDDGVATNGVLTYDFRAIPPTTATRGSTAQSREITVARTISNIALQNIRTIRVVGASNALTARR